ncbi:MAG: ABC transporter, fused permease protein [uncultured Acidimicrobiales bacterium]|uniref:ABC transporter, fused permease protein n=1 Tax=uncultured Acidimicrobiales bacterium TaxID=310071 RepID=A0A6J4IJ79_9ACTN|nr:MAG: ABC transporter, fused permease protein [uncultured Acidimicrobiales bacterium]
MVRAVLKGVLAHKLRLFLTAMAVVLGVSFVAGTFVLTDTINKTFDSLFNEISAGTDVSVRAASGFGEDAPAETLRDTVPASVLEVVRRVPGVQTADGTVSGYAQFVDEAGKAVTTTGAPTLGFNWTDPDLSPLTLRSGREPQRAGEVVVDAVTAKDHDFALGDTVKVLFRGPTEEFTVVGITGFGEADNLAGATLAIFDEGTAQRVFGKVGRFDSVEAKAVEGVSSLDLRDRVRSAVPPGVEVVTSQQVADESADSVQQALGFFGTALLVFAGISLFVGGFIILNTFSILVAQRTRELALLRALGASRRQVMVSVIAEAFLVGLFASLVGLGLGVLVALGLQELLKAFGIDLPAAGAVVRPRTIIASLVVGVGVTVLSSISPARKASKIAPMAALRGTGVEQGGSLRRRSVAGAVVTAVGAGAMLFGLFGGGISLVGLGAALVFVGVALLSPLAAVPMARVIGAPFPLIAGMSGKLGRQNAMRNPRRTAATAAALTVGLGLVACVSVLAASIKSSAADIVDEYLAADYIVSTANFMPSISTDLAPRLAQQPELAAVSGLQTGEWRAQGQSRSIYGADPASVGQVLKVDVTAGDIGGLARGEILVGEEELKDKKLEIGSTLPMTFARTGNQELRIAGTFAKNQLLGSYVVSTATFDANFTDRLDFVVLAKARAGTPPAAARAAVERVTADFPNVELRDQAEFKEQQENQVNQILGLVTALLALSIIIALFGIVNTLALSIFERTRELGLLRAVGMARRQVRSMIRGESVIIAVLGAVLGLGVGVLFGYAIVGALDDEGIGKVVIPGGQLIAYVVLAGIAGVVAAVFPARRAARLDVLAAISHE